MVHWIQILKNLKVNKFSLHFFVIFFFNDSITKCKKKQFDKKRQNTEDFQCNTQPTVFRVMSTVFRVGNLALEVPMYLSFVLLFLQEVLSPPLFVADLNIWEDDNSGTMKITFSKSMKLC